MELHLGSDEVAELDALLGSAIADLSPEIADTDNAHYRTVLRERREVLRSIHQRLKVQPPPSALSRGSWAC